MVFGNNGNDSGSKSPFVFIDYDKISDVILWFDRNYYMKLNVKLSKTDKKDKRLPFHSEYKTEYNNNITYSIRRDYTTYYSIECNDRSIADKNYVFLYPSDVYVLSMLIEKNILPWFMGDTRIYGKNKDDELFLKYTDTEKVYLPLNGGSFLSFEPTIITFLDGTGKEGITIAMNHENITFDITVDKFFQFAYIITRADMVSSAIGMINYVKSKPYLVNFKDLANN